MTIANNYVLTKQATDGSTKVFSFNYYALNENYIKVVKETGTTQVEIDPSEYTVDFDENDGTVTFTTAPASGSYIIIYRETPKEQETPFFTSSGFPAKVVETRLDKLTAMVQEDSEALDRSLKLPKGSSVSGDMPVPDPGKALIWNDDGDGFANSDDKVDHIVTTAQKWAEGSDADVTPLGGTHSSKGWSEAASIAATSAQNAVDALVNDAGYQAVKADLIGDNTIGTCANNLTTIGTVASDISDVNTCADNMALIQSAPTNATNAQTYAGNSGVWAEGTDAQVEVLGGEHSAKKWAELAEQDMTVSLKNLATGNNSLMILGNASTGANATGVGVSATANSNCSTAVGWSVKASSIYSTAVGSFTTEARGSGACAFGYSAVANANGAIQIGKGTNSTVGTVCFGITTDGVNWTNYTVLDATGKVPAGRLPIATSVSSLSTNDETVGAKLFYDTCGDIETLINAL